MVTLVMRGALVVSLIGAGWLVYQKMPSHGPTASGDAATETTLQIVLRSPADIGDVAVDIPVELYPVDMVAVHHEYFTERRAGTRFDDFLNERMKGRTPVKLKLDVTGQTSAVISPGNWWLHAVLSGEGNLEWRLPINVVGRRQTVELTPQNAYARTKSF
jgi:hypothetical protein